MRPCSAATSTPANAAMPASRLIVARGDRRRASSAGRRGATGKVTVGDPLDPAHQGRRDHHLRPSGQDHRLCRRRGQRRRHGRSAAARRSTSDAGQYLDADHHLRRHPGDGDRPRGGVRPGAVGADLRNRSKRRCTSPTTRPTVCRPACGAPDIDTCMSVGAARPCGNRLGEHLHGRLSRAALRRLQAVRSRTRTRHNAPSRTIPRTKTIQFASRPAHRLVGRLESGNEPGWTIRRSM